MVRCVPSSSANKEPACQCGRHKRCWFDPWAQKIPWRRKWQPIPVFLPGKFHGQEEPGRLQSRGSQRVRHDYAHMHSGNVGTVQVSTKNRQAFSTTRVIFTFPLYFSEHLRTQVCLLHVLSLTRRDKGAPSCARLWLVALSFPQRTAAAQIWLSQFLLPLKIHVKVHDPFGSAAGLCLQIRAESQAWGSIKGQYGDKGKHEGALRSGRPGLKYMLLQPF